MVWYKVDRDQCEKRENREENDDYWIKVVQAALVIAVVSIIRKINIFIEYCLIKNMYSMYLIVNTILMMKMSSLSGG